MSRRSWSLNRIARSLRDSEHLAEEEDASLLFEHPAIYDEETGEELKIPEMTDEDFNASYGKQLAKQGVKNTSRSSEAVAAAGAGAAGAGALAVSGKVLKSLLDSDDNDFDTNNIDMLHGKNITQATTQGTTQAMTQGAAAQAAKAAQ